MAQAAASSKRMHELPARRAELAERKDDPVRASIMEAMLAATGELGYREVAVHHVLERYGGHRVQFWQRFESKEECFALAYETWIDHIASDLLTAAVDEGDWRGGMRAALVTLFVFVDEHPDVARALFLEAEIAGGPALIKREETIARLGEVLDSARTQTAPAEQPPPLTGVFVAGGIATYVSEQLAAGTAEAIWEGLPELMRFATGPYFGEEAAEMELESARVFLEGRRLGRGPE